MAANLERIAEAAFRTPDFDADRVAAARSALAGGGYEVDAERIADRLVQIEAALQGHSRLRRS